MAKQLVTFVLDSERDKDIASYLENLPSGKKSEAIRVALREHMGIAGITLADVMRELDRIKSRLMSAATIQIADRADAPNLEEPDEAAKALDELLGS